MSILAATPLDSSTQSRLDRILKESGVAKTGKSVKVTNVVNPNILGG
jgi:F-type H+-transporting ATPase subunit O